jgi:hypothetical protein
MKRTRRTRPIKLDRSLTPKGQITLMPIPSEDHGFTAWITGEAFGFGLMLGTIRRSILGGLWIARIPQTGTERSYALPEHAALWLVDSLITDRRS